MRVTCRGNAIKEYTQSIANYCLYLYTYIARVRLVNGPNPHLGCVEIYTNSTGGLDNGEWGSICDGNWNFKDARVVCHQLGYLDAVVAPMSTHFGQGNGPIWLNLVQCLGTESDLFLCRNNGIAKHICDHGKYASAECLGTAM